MTLVAEELQAFRTPRGATAYMVTRPDTVDHDICASSMPEDEYKLAPLELTGLAIDIGAHIGAVTVALALDNPTLRIKAVEIVPENIAVLRQNLERNGVADRVEVIEMAAGGPDELSRTCYMRHRAHPVATEAYVNKHRFIGNSFWSPTGQHQFDSEAVEIPCISLDELATERVSFLKIDCEGAEWEFFNDPKALERIDTIYGEFHWDYVGQGDEAVIKPGSPKRAKRATTAQAEMARLLGGTHTLTIDEHPTIGHFEAVRQ